LGNHAIDYKIYGDDMQFVEIEHDPEETVVAEAGSLFVKGVKTALFGGEVLGYFLSL
jgi:uncharacterized protein (AIM24 family)